MAAAREAGSDTIGAFIDWLQSHGYVIAQWNRNELMTHHDILEPAWKPIEHWLADYYGIDLNKVDDERKAILEELRKKHVS